eukprot:1644104-Prorocentrum_lima.AAC.1
MATPLRALFRCVGLIFAVGSAEKSEAVPGAEEVRQRKVHPGFGTGMTSEHKGRPAGLEMFEIRLGLELSFYGMGVLNQTTGDKIL